MHQNEFERASQGPSSQATEEAQGPAPWQHHWPRITIPACHHQVLYYFLPRGHHKPYALKDY